MQTTARVERIAMLLDRASRGKKSSFFPGAASVDTCAAPSAVTSAAAQKGFHLVATDSAQAAPAPARQSRQPQCSSAVRAWRFPSSRRFLWDRTPVAPCVHLHPQVDSLCDMSTAVQAGLELLMNVAVRTDVFAYNCSQATSFCCP